MFKPELGEYMGYFRMKDSTGASLDKLATHTDSAFQDFTESSPDTDNAIMDDGSATDTKGSEFEDNTNDEMLGSAVVPLAGNWAKLAAVTADDNERSLMMN